MSTEKAEVKAFAATLIEQLGETQPAAGRQLEYLVHVLGIEFIQKMYQLTLETEA